MSMNRRALCLLVALLCLPVPAALAKAPGHRLGNNPDFALPNPETKPGVTVDSASLVENARAWDGRSVTFTGEAVGEMMARGDRAWIHLNDDAYMWKNIEEGAVLGGYNSGHAVWTPTGKARLISFFGDYKHEGDIVRVTGTFHAACPDHGGDMDIHADDLAVVRPGHPVDHVLNKAHLTTAVLLFFVVGGFALMRRRAALRRI
jgi:hypothetical protein